VGSALFEQARRAVDVGFDGVSVPEHHGQPGYVPNPILVAAALGVRLGEGWVAAAPVLASLRAPEALAEDVAWAGLVTGGRFGVVLGAGYDTNDFAALGVPYAERMPRFRDAVQAVLPLSDGSSPSRDDPAFELAGRCPVQVLLATSSPRNSRLAAENGLGLFLTPLLADVARRRTDRYRGLGGRGPVTVSRWAWLGRHPVEQQEAMNVRIANVPGDLPGRRDGPNIRVESSTNPAELADTLGRIVTESGGTSVSLRVHLPGISHEEQLTQITEIGQNVLPRLRDALGLESGGLSRAASAGAGGCSG
jgi:alkanesulfonate monooxygenase SsuD/methylene tetrahydromethanopterin reductase-like flavin-dependent oxidoreductase (luciferase family)